MTERPIRHGTVRAYKDHGCRCDLCRAAQAAAVARWKERRKAAIRAGAVDADAITHGLTGYDQGCRCSICEGARRDYDADRRWPA